MSDLGYSYGQPGSSAQSLSKENKRLKAEVAELQAALAAQQDGVREATIEECAKIADAYAEENLRMAGDTILLDPCLMGNGFTPENVEISQKQMINGCIHSSMHHAAKNIANAIRRLEQGVKP